MRYNSCRQLQVLQTPGTAAQSFLRQTLRHVHPAQKATDGRREYMHAFGVSVRRVDVAYPAVLCAHPRAHADRARVDAPSCTSPA